jgi:hypothetical protein
VADVDGLIVQVLPAADSDVEELADLTGGAARRTARRGCGLGRPADRRGRPAGGEGARGSGWLAAGPVRDLDGLRAAVAAVHGWTSRTGRTVEVSVGGDVLKVTAVTSQQQREIIDAWLARHAPAG